MKKIELVVTNPTGLHTRPGTGFVKLAKTFQSYITIKKSDKESNAKSLVKVLQIGISQGDTIVLTASGTDEQQAINALSAYMRNLSE